MAIARGLGAAVVAGVLLTASAAASTTTVPAAAKRLSNERTLTRSAHVVYDGFIRISPSLDARRLGRLRLVTEDGYPETYLLLRSYTDANGHQWIQIRIPGRPNGRVGWVERSDLGRFHSTRWWIVVNRRHLKITVYRNGKRRWQRPVGIGKPSTPTPAGRFWIRERIAVKDPRSPYWPYALGTADYSVLSEWPGGGVVGIHGDWNQPQLIPGRPSHGCIRLHDADVKWLARHVPVGTPLRVL